MLNVFARLRLIFIMVTLLTVISILYWLHSTHNAGISWPQNLYSTLHSGQGYINGGTSNSWIPTPDQRLRNYYNRLSKTERQRLQTLIYSQVEIELLFKLQQLQKSGIVTNCTAKMINDNARLTSPEILAHLSLSLRLTRIAGQLQPMLSSGLEAMQQNFVDQHVNGMCKRDIL